MSDCGVCLYADHDNCEGYIDEVKNTILDVDAKCCECSKIVTAGHPIEQASFMPEEADYIEENDDAWVLRSPIYTCLVCAEIAEAFYCDGRMYGSGLWEQLREIMGELTTSCFDRLKTPQAKAELRRQWMEWKGLKC